MRTNVVRLQRFAGLPLCVFGLCATGLASSIISVSGTASPNTCSQTSGAANVSCSVANGQSTASGLGIATWETPGGRLEATSDAVGSASSTASVSYSNTLIVTGASGSGELTIQFMGFQDIFSQSPAGGTVSQLMVTVGANSTAVTFPFTNSAFTATLPVTFGVFLPFNVSFSDTAQGTIFMGGLVGHGNGDAVLLNFPNFVVTNSAGAPIPGTVEFVPEPAAFGLLLCAGPMLWLAGRRRGGARA
jgi:hypothetical protein